MDLDTRSLELLEAVAQHGSLTAASRHLHVSQPALSQRLTGLEARLGMPLFERHGRRLVPTRAGRRMLHASVAVLNELRAAERDLADLRAERGGVLRFATQCATNYQWLPPVVHAFRDRFPDVEVRIESVRDDDVVGALLAGALDVAVLVKADARLDGLATRPLFDDEMVAVVAAGHPWVGRDHVEAADFDGVELVLYDTYDPARSPAVPLPIPPGARPARVTTTPAGVELMIEIVASSQAVTVIPRWLVEPYLSARPVAAVRITAHPEARTWQCVTQRGEARAHVRGFVDLLGDSVDRNGATNGLRV